MRIQNLKMTAFGSFARETEIDFTRFGTQDVYLISGETGSGKTTIFDAMMFALYGTGSGDDRKPVMFRSEYADETVETVVTLEFQYGNRSFRITRKPGGYEILKKNGKGTRQAQASVELIDLQKNEAYTKDGEVRTQMQRILGVNRNQFKQIAMLAQGEFKQLLTENTADKQEMFRTIFHTGNYERLVQTLKTMQDAQRESYQMHRDNIVRERKNILVDEASSCYEEVQRYQNMEDVTDLESFLSLVKTYQSQQDHKKKHLQELYEQTENEIRALDVTIAANERLIRITKNIREAEQYLKDHEAERETLQTQFEHAQTEEKQTSLWNQRIGEIQSRMPQYERLSQLQGGMKQSQQNRQKYTEMQKNTISALEKNRQQTREVQEICAKKEEILLSFNQAQRALDEQRRNAQFYREVLEKIKDVKKEESAAELYAQQKKEAHKAFSVHNQMYRNLEDAYYASQAGLLAKKIVPHQPCPVCGSLEHNDKHIHALLENLDENVSKETLDAQKIKKERLETKLQEIIAKQAKQDGQFQAKKLELSTLVDTLGIVVTELESLQNTVTARLRDLELAMQQTTERQKKFETEKKACERAEQQRVKLAEENEELSLKLKEAEVQISKEETAYQIAQQEEQSIRQTLQYASAALAQKAISDMEKEIVRLKRALENAKAALERYDNAMMERKNHIALWKKELLQHTVQDARVLQEQKESLLQKEEETNRAIHAISAGTVTNQNALRVLEKEWKAYRETEKKWAPIRELYLTFDGNYGDRIKLETFIQTAYFDRILARANIRLFEMSNEQYQLQRKAGTSDKRTKGGMDIEVWDTYTNSHRDIASLSGGETFMASLALALGLSDEVQQRAGGVQFDSLFIDEGFGSLDDGTLSKAVSVLAQLSMNHCTIGIISHVAALMERIEKQIVVKKDPVEGSSVEIHA